MAEREAPENPFFRRWAELVLAHRGLSAGLMVLVTVGMLYVIKTSLRVDNTAESFLPGDSEAALALEELRDEFGRDDVFMLLVEGDVFSLPYLERLKALHEATAAIDMEIPSLGERRRDRLEREGRAPPPKKKRPAKSADKPAAGSGREAGGDDDFGDFGEGDFGADDFSEDFTGDEGWGDEEGGTIIEDVRSLINVRQTRWEDGGLKVEGLLDEWPTEADLPALKERVLSDRTIVNQVVGERGRHSALVIRTGFMSEQDSEKVFARLTEVARAHEAEGFSIKVAGAPAINATLNGLVVRDMQVLFLVSLIAMFLLLFLIFRHVLGIVGPVGVVILSTVWTVGLMAAFDMPMTIVSNILPAFFICVGIGDSVHIQSVYRDYRRLGFDNHEAIVKAVATVGLPVLFTSLTTMVGLFSFQFATLVPIQDMGLAGGIGVFLAFAHSVLVLPIVLSFNKKSLLGARPERHGADLLDRILGRCDAASRDYVADGRVRTGRRKVVFVVTLLLTGAAAYGISLSHVGHDPLSWIPDSVETKQAFTTMDAEMGGTGNVSLLISAPEGKDLKSREVLLALEKLEAHVKAFRHPRSGRQVVGNAQSVVDVVRESWRAIHEEDEAFYAIPPTERGVDDMIQLFENQGPEELKRLATIDMAKAVMIIRVLWLDALEYTPLSEHIHRGIEEHLEGLADVRPTGQVYNLISVAGRLLWDLMRSFGFALIVITIMMVILLREVKLGLIAMVPNLLPIVFILGAMGAMGIPLDINNLMVASISIGIAVDDTIHFLHQFRSHFRAHGDVDAAISHAFSHSGRAIAATSAILVAGFLVFLFASVYNVQRFGSLVAMTVVFAISVDLIVAPALLRTFYGKKPRV